MYNHLHTGLKGMRFKMLLVTDSISFTNASCEAGWGNSRRHPEPSYWLGTESGWPAEGGNCCWVVLETHEASTLYMTRVHPPLVSFSPDPAQNNHAQDCRSWPPSWNGTLPVTWSHSWEMYERGRVEVGICKVEQRSRTSQQLLTQHHSTWPLDWRSKQNRKKHAAFWNSKSKS